MLKRSPYDSVVQPELKTRDNRRQRILVFMSPKQHVELSGPCWVRPRLRPAPPVHVCMHPQGHALFTVDLREDANALVLVFALQWASLSPACGG